MVRWGDSHAVRSTREDRWPKMIVARRKGGCARTENSCGSRNSVGYVTDAMNFYVSKAAQPCSPFTYNQCQHRHKHCLLFWGPQQRSAYQKSAKCVLSALIRAQWMKLHTERRANSRLLCGDTCDTALEGYAFRSAGSPKSFNTVHKKVQNRTGSPFIHTAHTSFCFNLTLLRLASLYRSVVLASISVQSVVSESQPTMSKRGHRLKRLWRIYTRKVLLAASFVVIPMVAFTITIVAIVFSNIVDPKHCPRPELCPYRDVAAVNSSDYYVDFSVGRLAFVSSLSSTISLTLVAAVMTMYGYVVANHFLHASKAPDKREGLPSPYEASTIKRLLNAEVLLLLGTIMQGCRWLWQFTKCSPQRERARQNKVLRSCRIVFVLGLFTRQEPHNLKAGPCN